MPYIAEVEGEKFCVDLEREGHRFTVSLNGKSMNVEVVEARERHLFLIIENKPYNITIEDDSTISVNGERFRVSVKDEQLQAPAKLKSEVTHACLTARQVGEIKVTAPMPGLVIEVEVKPGDIVKTGSGLLIVEAMKMQNEIKAPRDGVVKQVLVKQGMPVNGGDVLVVIE